MTMHSQKHLCVSDAHTHIFVYLQAPCVHTYPHTHAQVTRAMLIHVCVRTHIHTRPVTHTVCSHVGICVHIQASSTQACLSTCAHTFLHTPTHALAHVCTPTHAHVPVASLTLPAAGCISGAPARAALPGVGLASTSPPRPLREPFCPCLPWTWGSVTGPSPGWQLCPSILRALLFLQNMRLEIPPREACLLSPAGWRGARFTGLLCAPRGKPSSDLISAMGSCRWATSLSLCLGAGLTQLAVEACRRNGWSEGPGDLHPPQPHWMPVGSPVRVAVGGTQQHFTQSQTRPPRPAGPSWLHSVEVLDLRSCLSPYLLSGSPRTSCLPWPLFSHLSSGAIDWMV
ncbi:uncharacterized protein LOC122696284 [Cervus elaphus]|uniref:uncharacterized protein LOC122696284 n=1 Tax=Cervus elaphus TaxID=9860 RepID=UPI001CC28F43|nr:uncharacterized protein LOC122696284 [Cervus elaphus]